MSRAGSIGAWVVQLFAVGLAGWAIWQAFALTFTGFDESGALHEGALLVIATSAATFLLAVLAGWRAVPLGGALARTLWPAAAGIGARWLALVLGVVGACLCARGLFELVSLPTARLVLRAIARSAELQSDEAWLMPTLATDVALLAGGALVVFAASRIGGRATT